MRQGCPLSGILFALSVDLLLRAIDDILAGDAVVRGYADDTAIVLEDYLRDMPPLCKIFEQFENVSGLSLNVLKIVLIPLFPFSSVAPVRNLVREHCPRWSQFIIAGCGKYLGFVIGPAAGHQSWKSALQKFHDRAEWWAQKHLGLFLNTQVYRVYIHSTLGFLAQLCELPPDLSIMFKAMLRKLAPGPGNWLIQKDLCNLTKFGMKGEFAHPSWMAAASKLRVSEYVIKDFANLHKSLEQVHSEYYRRPFGQWHYQSFVHILDKNARMMQSVGCSADKVRRMMPSRNASHFQRTATIIFVDAVSLIILRNAECASA